MMHGLEEKNNPERKKTKQNRKGLFFDWGIQKFNKLPENKPCNLKPSCKNSQSSAEQKSVSSNLQ